MPKQEPQQPQYAPQPDPSSYQYVQVPQNTVAIQVIQPGISGWLMCFVLLIGVDILGALVSLIAYAMGIEFVSVVGILLLVSALASIGVSITTIVLISLRKSAGRILAMVAAVVNSLNGALFWISIIPKSAEAAVNNLNSTTYAGTEYLAVSNPDSILITQISIGISYAVVALISILYFALSKRVKVTLVE